MSRDFLREIYSHLSQWEISDHSTLSFYPLIQLTSDPQKSKAHLRVSEAVLYTLAGYLDWVSMNLIFTNNSVLLQMLCLLLGNSSLQLLAAECLLTIVGRKVNYNQEVFFICFSSNCIIFTLKIIIHGTYCTCIFTKR